MEGGALKILPNKLIVVASITSIIRFVYFLIIMRLPVDVMSDLFNKILVSQEMIKNNYFCVFK